MIAELPQALVSLLWILAGIAGFIVFVILILMPIRIAERRQIAKRELVSKLTVVGILIHPLWLAALIIACLSKRNGGVVTQAKPVDEATRAS